MDFSRAIRNFLTSNIMLLQTEYPLAYRKPAVREVSHSLKLDDRSRELRYCGKWLDICS